MSKDLRLLVSVALSVCICGIPCVVYAMGGTPPKEEKTEKKPEYKLEILKMEVITSPSPTPEAKGPGAACELKDK
jgi:hypothetical protein